MKNYELIQKLLNAPAGAEAYFGHTVTEEDMAGYEAKFIERKVMDVDENNMSVMLMG